MGLSTCLSLGRVGWSQRMGAPSSEEAARHVKEWEEEQRIVEHATELVRRLEVTWHMIETTLTT
ncbi:hypothetical protein KSF_007870 [Reticulibacter mediterranei]|uniref:Uncharacterized protein n=2 Tax=Reticulibacter mediterranei TaxID=2778369 RepID=A0A8J3IGE3_9CHLR|nr:hypothetical protein KSF_007870 [Reticulibacter mediterranei]